MKEKPLNEKDMIKRLVKNYTELKREYDKFRKGYAEAVSGLIKDIYKDGKIDLCFSDKVLEYINKRMGNFNSLRSIKGNMSKGLCEDSPEDTHVKKDKGCGKIIDKMIERCRKRNHSALKWCPRCKDYDKVKQKLCQKCEEKER